MSEDQHHRTDYDYFLPLDTRWADNDIYGHVNNVTYYSYFDTVVNHFLIQEGGLDIHKGEVIAFVVASACQYLTPIAYPEKIEAAFRVNRLGNSSVEYGVALFKYGADTPAAHGSFTHVFVRRADNTSTRVPEGIRTAFSNLKKQ